MTANHSFRTSARWTTHRQGIVEGEPPAPPIPFSAPPQFQGEPGLWTPEHFLLAAVVTCFITTFRAISELSKFEAAGLEVSAEGRVEKTEDGFRFTKILLKPVLTVNSDREHARGLRLLEKTERSCLVSHSLKSEVRMDPTVLEPVGARTV